jgi:hypothetical protein
MPKRSLFHTHPKPYFPLSTNKLAVMLCVMSCQPIILLSLLRAFTQSWLAMFSPRLHYPIKSHSIEALSTVMTHVTWKRHIFSKSHNRFATFYSRIDDSRAHLLKKIFPIDPCLKPAKMVNVKKVKLQFSCV